ncbi:MAG: sulfite exporter TauE/SafE family protein [Burkholderiaceae bacterium]|nr:sulfite exporter TauE/SafE family protein [Burkholderiaceae bacterium]
MPDLAWLLLIAFGVGALIGAVGIGGVLLIPALTAFAALPIQTAMATALFTFTFTGIVGTLMFQRRGSIDWSVTRPVLYSAVVFAFLGAWTNSIARPTALALILAGIIVLAGLYTLFTWRGMRRPAFHDDARAQRVLLLTLGAVAGFGSGLTGVGGPALSVPLMVLFGFPALVAIGTSQVIQIVAAISGTLGNLKFGSIDFGIAATVTLIEMAGVMAGVRIAHAVDGALLRKAVAVLCLVVGTTLIVRELGGLQ